MSRTRAAIAGVVALSLVTGCEAPDAGAASKPAVTPAAASPLATSGEAAAPAAVAVAPAPRAAAIPDGLARVVVFRGGSWGLMANLLKPAVKVDGAEVGICDHDSVIQRDIAPGPHDVSMQTDIIARVSTTLAAGQTAYFKCYLLPFGVVVSAPAIEQVAAGDAPAKIASLPAQ